MTRTTFKLLPEKLPLDVDLGLLQQSLPASMSVDERSDGTYISVETSLPEDVEAQALVDRELDRLFFLTYVRVRAEMCKRTVTCDLTCSYRIHGRLDPAIQAQIWIDHLALQLRLWALAASTVDPASKLLLLFQVIELAFPDSGDQAEYPKYVSAALPPHPRTEAKLLRHLVAHAGVPRQEVATYLQYLGLNPILSNHSDPAWRAAISGKVALVQKEAYETIKNAL